MGTQDQVEISRVEGRTSDFKSYQSPLVWAETGIIYIQDIKIRRLSTTHD